MTAVLDVAVGRMLAAFGTRVSEERVIAFTEAVEEASQCEPCAVRACKNLSGSMKRCPYPVNLVEETRTFRVPLPTWRTSTTGCN